LKENITYSPELQLLLDTWYLATNSNDATAQFDLASVLFKSKQKAAHQKAFAIFKKLAKQGYTTIQTDARYMLGRCYESGYGIQKSYQRAIQWYEKAEKNIVEDLTHNPDPVGEEAHKALEKTLEEEYDIDEALDDVRFGKITSDMIDCITDAAESGDVDSQKYLMDLYDLGYDRIKPDEEECAYWAQKAAENGNIEAMSKLGNQYYFGRGVNRDFRKAFYWLKKAAAQGCESAVYRLGAHYKSFNNYKEAVKWYRLYAWLRIKWRNKRLGWEK